MMDLLSAKVGSGCWQYLVFWYCHLDKDAHMHISLDSKRKYDCVSTCPSIVPGVINMMSCGVIQRRDQEKDW